MEPLNTARVLSDSRAVWTSILEATEGLTEAQWATPTACPGWDVSDQIAHLIGIELMLLGEPIPEVDLGHLEYVDTPFKESIEAWIEVRRTTPGDELREEFADVMERRAAQLESMSEDFLDGLDTSPVGQVPRREFFGSVRILDCWLHEQDIRRALERPGGRFGAGELRTLERARIALPRVVGKGAQPPEGAAVTFEIAGPQGGSFRLEVHGGRAAEVEASTATATLAMDQWAFLQRFAGRSDAGGQIERGEVVLSGDQELARRVLVALAVMI